MIFIATDDGDYEFSSTIGTTLSESSVNLRKNEAVVLQYNMGEVEFGEIFVNSNYEIDVGENYLEKGIAYFEYDFHSLNAYIFKFQNINEDIEACVTDKDGYILNQTTNGSNITYLCNKNTYYRVYLFPHSKQNILFSYEISNKIYDAIELKEDEDYYVSYKSDAINYCQIDTNTTIYEVFNSEGTTVNVAAYLMSLDEKLFFRLGGNSTGVVYYIITYASTQLNIGEEHELITNFHDAFNFSTYYSMVYKFDHGARYDIYTIQGLLYSNVNEAYLESYIDYVIVDKYDAPSIRINYKVVESTINDSVFYAEANTLYKLNLSDYGFYDITDRNNIELYDAFDKNIAYNNGYRIYPNYVILISSVAKQINLTKKSVYFEVNLNNGYDSVVMSKQVEYANKFNLGTLTRECYIFIGWKLNGNLATNNKGEGFELWNVYANTTLTATWAIKDLYVTIDNNGDVNWVTSTGLTKNIESAKILSMQSFNTIIDNLLNLVYTNDIVNEGYSKEIHRLKTDESNIYFTEQFEIIWHTEEYNVVFIADDNERKTIKLTYGASFIDSDMQAILYMENNSYYSFMKWYNNLYNVEIISMRDFQKVPDFSSGVENNKIIDVVMFAKRVGISINVKFTLITTSISTTTPQSRSEEINKTLEYGKVYSIPDNLFDRKGVTITGAHAVNCVYSTANNSIQITGDYIDANSVTAEIQYQSILCNIIIDLETGEELFGNSKNFVKHYNTYSPTFTLPNAKSTRKEHLGWEIMGSTYGINQIYTVAEQYFGNITIKPIFGDNIIYIENDKTYNVSEDNNDFYDCITYDFSQATNNITFIMGKNIDHVIFKGYGTDITNIYIEFVSNLEVNIDLIDCRFIGKPLQDNGKYGCVLNTSGVQRVNMNIKGSVLLKQRETNYNCGNLYIGALTTSSVNLYSLEPSSKLNLVGGNGVGNAGMQGIDGGQGWYAGRNTVIRLYVSVSATGGNGADGLHASNRDSNGRGNNGGRGGNAGYAFYTENELNVNLGFSLTGLRGTPGKGGNGYSGANGRDAVWFGPSSTAGSDGGNGGDGGISRVSFYFRIRTGAGLVYNFVGAEGKGGTGGLGGTGGKPLSGARRPNGARGLDGRTYSAAQVN